jgi:hypothetical protein
MAYVYIFKEKMLKVNNLAVQKTGIKRFKKEVQPSCKL